MKNYVVKGVNLKVIHILKCFLPIFYFSLYIMILGSCNNAKKGNENLTDSTYVDSLGFSFEIPEGCENITNGELGLLLKENNPYLDFLGSIGFPWGNSLLAVSTYIEPEPISIDTAFIQTAKYAPPYDGYRLVDYGIKQSRDKILRYKISSFKDSVFSVMYYYMKDDYSRILNEMKLTCRSEKNINTIQNYLEKVAKTVSYKKQ
jgi:hypothetical protein